MTEVKVDSKSFLVVDGCKICKITPDGKLQFCDKDRMRSQRRGTRFVVVSPAEIASAASASTPAKNPAPSTDSG